MPSKKSTPVKKVTSKKAVSKNIKGVWKQTGHLSIPGLAPLAIEPPIGETRVFELEAENYALKALLSKQSDPMPQTQANLPTRATMLSQFAEQLDGQLSRLYNSLNTLDALANRLLIQKEDNLKGNMPEAHDLSTRYSNLLNCFSSQNDRLDSLNTKLSDLI